MDAFDKIDGATEETTVAETKVDAVLKEQQTKENNAFVGKLKGDADFRDTFKSRCNDLEVTASLAFGESGNVVLDKNAPVDPENPTKRTLVPTSQIVGYAIKNISDTPISYVTTKAVKGEDGLYTETEVEAVLAPGATANVQKKYLAMLTSNPEFSFTVANGTMKGQFKDLTKFKTVDDALRSVYFMPSDKNIKVNSDSFKVNISTEVVGTDGKNTWVVLPEYEEVFGILNNPVATGTKKRAKSSIKVERRDVAADFIQSLMRENSKM